MRSKKIVLVSGGFSSGKSSIARGLETEFGFKRLSSKHALEELAKQKFNGRLPGKRGFLQKFGTDLDESTQGKWVRDHFQSEIVNHDLIVIDCVRIPEQVTAFRSSYSTSVMYYPLNRLDRFSKTV